MNWFSYQFRGRNKKIILYISICIAVATIAYCPAALATDSSADTASKPKDWSVFISAYGWLAGIEGTAANGGSEQEVNIPFTDLASLTDSGFMLDVEIWWRKWFVNFDGTWATLKTQDDGTLVDLDVSLDQTIYDISIGREIYSRSLDKNPASVDPDWRQSMRVDLFAGARYFSTEPTIDIRSFLGTQDQISFSEKRWDPVIGLRFMSALSKRWLIALSGDVGGFGIGNAAKFTWQLEGEIGFRVTRWFSVFAGYRALSFDTIDGEGAQRSGADLFQHGPLIGAGFNF